MRLAFPHRDIDSFRWLVPFVTGLVAVCLSVMPLHVPGLAVATPAFVLMAIYHWTLYRPDLVLPSGVFVLGLLLDLLDGTTYIGISSLTFLAVRGLVLLSRNRIANQPFPIVWAGFLAIAGAALALEWLTLSVLTLTPLAARPFMFQLLVTAAAFPLAGYALAQLQRGLLGPPVT
ncbi:MAG TPA: rod shape-determining protein MreD [Stellaceae bacterium]|jgi:rod shape-determining protein MreD|nr:rod shape-determining protein MreD [Stellaceae bacterium]